MIGTGLVGDDGGGSFTILITILITILVRPARQGGCTHAHELKLAQASRRIRSVESWREKVGGVPEHEGGVVDAVCCARPPLPVGDGAPPHDLRRRCTSTPR